MMSMRTWQLVRAALPFALALATSSAFAAAAAPPRIHLRGSAHIDAHWARAGGAIALSGTVVDDTAHAVGGARVGLRVTAADGSPLGFVNAAPAACSEGAAPPAVEAADALVLPADDSGRFCVRLVLAAPAAPGRPPSQWVAHLESRATGSIDAARLDVPVDLALTPMTLRFDPEPRSVQLDEDDRGSTNRVFEVVASTEEQGVTTGAANLEVTLSNETGARLATATTNASGRALFQLRAGLLGAPGRGELRASFAGNATTGASMHVVPIERRTHVDLAAPDAREGRLTAGVPEDGVEVRVVATLRCARVGCPGAPNGTIEVRVGDDEAVAGAGALKSGEAQVVARFSSASASASASMADPAQLHVRYAPDAPWLQPGNELSLLQPVRPPSAWKKLPPLLAGLLAIAWLVLARLPPRKTAEARASGASPSPAAAPPEAGIELVRSGPAAQGWTGRLRDAHDGYAIAGARVAAERRGFPAAAVAVAGEGPRDDSGNDDGMTVLAETVTDQAGSFALRLPPGSAAAAQPGDELTCEGPLHGELRRPLPEPGELDVALVLRRRALLDRLVAWARRRGLPFDARPEPTPGHVRRAAAGEFTVARWADAVERAAFGGQVVDARAEGEIERLVPADQRGGPPAAKEPGGPR